LTFRYHTIISKVISKEPEKTPATLTGIFLRESPKLDFVSNFIIYINNF